MHVRKGDFSIVPEIGEVIHVKTPPRFVITDPKELAARLGVLKDALAALETRKDEHEHDGER